MRFATYCIVIMAVCVILGVPMPALADFEDNGDGTVTDLETQFMWQQMDDATTRDWESALAYCEDLDLASYTDWRLPDVHELLSLVDHSQYNPAIDVLFVCRTSYYWTSSPDAGGTYYAWFVKFSDGYAGDSYRNYNYYVRCVRGGP